MAQPTPNQDEQDAPFIGNIHKSLPHDKFGEVIPEAYEQFSETCLKVENGIPLSFEEVQRGKCPKKYSHAKFVSPLAGASTETHGPDPKDLEMPPAPGILSASSAAEMVELYWMALLRDTQLYNYGDDDRVHQAVDDISQAYQSALDQDDSDGAVKLGLDLPVRDGKLDIRAETLFGCGLKGEEVGPWISQFFLQEGIPYGVQSINPMQFPYSFGEDYLTNYEDWLCLQNSGTDRFGRDYGGCNFYDDQVQSGANYYYTGEKRFISTFRDMARFVNRDALHQSYFNAALLLDAVGAPVDSGNPYATRYSRSLGFATWGGPDLLTLVSEVASRALKAVWRQKWLVHRRCRPEAFGGLLHVQEIGNAKGDKKQYGIGSIVSGSAGATALGENGSFLLPMAFSAGSPNHPAYEAGHATVAGACATILKAWFDENASLNGIFKKLTSEPHNTQKEPGNPPGIKQPGCRKTDGDDCKERFELPGELCDVELTVGGELNKLASNVSMGRSLGGVHWRSDNTRSLRLGEQIAVDILRKRVSEYAEAGTSFSFTSFDGDKVSI